MMSVNYYEILEIPSDADEREIKRAYHRLARELHPDKAASPEEARRVEERFALVSAAYNALKDPERRAEYSKGAAKNGGAASTNGSGGAATATARVLAASRARAAETSGAASTNGAAQPAKPAVAGAGATATATTPKPGGGGITPERVAIAQKAFARGMQYYKEDNIAKAITFFEAAIQNNDQEPMYHSRLAMSLIREKRSATRAIDAAQRAIDLDPYNLEHKFNIAFIYETIGSKSNAQRVYEEIIRWDKDNNRAKLALASLNKKRGPFGLGGAPKQTPAERAASAPEAAGTGGFLERLMSRFKH